jgi:hypothetical protein
LNAQTATAAAERYYDFDAIITLGSLALAGGALAAVALAVGRREKREHGDDHRELSSNWRDAVMQNLEADLTSYARSWRKVA